VERSVPCVGNRPKPNWSTSKSQHIWISISHDGRTLTAKVSLCSGTTSFRRT